MTPCEELGSLGASGAPRLWPPGLPAGRSPRSLRRACLFLLPSAKRRARGVSQTLADRGLLGALLFPFCSNKEGQDASVQLQAP